MYIKWLTPDEIIYLKEAARLLEEKSVENAAKILTFDWPPSSKERLTSLFQSKNGFIQDENDSLIIPLQFRFITFHPLEAIDAYSANMVSTLDDSLIDDDEARNFSPGSAHSQECLKGELRLYLRKGAHFHDGSLLTATDVLT